MTTDERKSKIAELRAYHAGNVVLPATCYFTAKYPHTPEGKDEKCIGLYESEISKGDDIYLELVNMDYTPLDSSRTLYKWEHEKGWNQRYTIKKEQYMIPVSELKVVHTIETYVKHELPTTVLYPEVNGSYQHYKGGKYKVLMLAKHTENDEVLVIYQSIHFGSYHARPLSQWFDKIKGTEIPRFKLIKQ